jgi:hypothetical protein
MAWRSMWTNHRDSSAANGDASEGGRGALSPAAGRGARR